MLDLVSRLLGFVSSVVRWLWYFPRFSHLGFRSVIYSPLKIDCGKNIYIGKDVRICYKTWLAANPLTGKSARLEIRDGCVIGNFNHIYSTHSIVLHKNVLTADKVYISDNLHGYVDINVPILKQPIVQKGCVEIGEGSWLGENVCVIGAKIGKHCVIGANSVVTKDIPDYSVAVGIPAKVIKQYDFETNSWKKNDPFKGDTMDMGGGRFGSLVCAA